MKSQDQIPCVKQIKATHSPVPGSRILKGAEPGLSVCTPLCSSLGPSVKPLGCQGTARKPPILPVLPFHPWGSDMGRDLPMSPSQLGSNGNWTQVFTLPDSAYFPTPSVLLFSGGVRNWGEFTPDRGGRKSPFWAWGPMPTVISRPRPQHLLSHSGRKAFLLKVSVNPPPNIKKKYWFGANVSNAR